MEIINLFTKRSIVSNPTMSDSDVFIISAVSNTNSAEAIQQAINNAGINSIRVQDVIFGLESGRFLPYHEPRSIDTEKIISASGLTCSAATVSSSFPHLLFRGPIHLKLRRGCSGCRRRGNQRFHCIIVSFTGCGRKMRSSAASASQRVR